MASMEKDSRETGSWPPHQLPFHTILNGKYMIQRVLGEGGFGITYEGWDLNLELRVAIKEYFPSGFVTRGNTDVIAHTGSGEEYYEKGKEKFLSEAKILARFYFLPGIVGVKDFFLENNTAYIVMEFLDGVTLKEYAGRAGGRLEAGEVLELMRPVMASLAQVHNSGLIHRDISPENIMITKEGQVKLLDFGAARDISPDGQKSLSVLLKPGYAPEEQYRTHGEQGPWTDVYALCATMYRCMTGQAPQEPLERARKDGLKPPSMLGAKLKPEQDMAIMKGLALYAENRYQSIPELQAALYGQPAGFGQKSAAGAESGSGAASGGASDPGVTRPVGGASDPGVTRPVNGASGAGASGPSGGVSGAGASGPMSGVSGGPSGPGGPRPAGGGAPYRPYGGSWEPPKKKGKKGLILALVLLICVLAGGGIWLLTRESETAGGDGYRVRNQMGNTNGNVHNMGQLLQGEDGSVYYADPFNGGFYQWDDIEHTEGISDRWGAFLGAQDGWIYYLSTMDAMVYRIQENDFARYFSGEAVGGEDVEGFLLADDQIFYFTNAGEIRRMDPDGENDVLLVDNEYENTALNISGGNIYFLRDQGGRYIYRADTDGNSLEQVSDEECGMFIVEGDWIYYSGIARNGALCRIPVSGGEPEELGGIKANIFNVFEDRYLYYTDGENGGMGRYEIDTGETETVSGLPGLPRAIYTTEDPDGIYCLTEGSLYHVAFEPGGDYEIQEVSGMVSGDVTKEETAEEETTEGETDGSGYDVSAYVYQGRELDGADTILDRIDSSDMENIPLGQINEAGSTGFEYRVDSYTPPEGSGSGGSVTLRVPVSYRYSGPGLQLVESDFIVIAMNEAENDLWLCVPDGNMGESFPIAVQDTDGGVGQLILEYQVPEGYDYIFTQTNIYNGSVEGPLYLTFLE